MEVYLSANESIEGLACTINYTTKGYCFDDYFKMDVS